MNSNKENIALSMEGVSKILGGVKRIQDMNLCCNYGKIYGLIGPNGSGKTTLLKLITGLYRADEGEVRVCGLDPVKDYKKTRKQFGLLPQDNALYPELSARQNLQFYGALYFDNPKALCGRIDEILKLIDLKDREKEPVKNFSGGMKRRLGIGMALLNDPQLVFLDEPTLGVDVHNSHRIWNYIRNLKEQGKTVIVTTNVMSEAEQLCDEIFIIEDGKKICEGTPDELKKSVGASYIEVKTEKVYDDEMLQRVLGEYQKIDEKTVRIQAPSGEQDLLRVLEQTKEVIEIQHISLKNPTLDDVFLFYTGNQMEERV